MEKVEIFTCGTSDTFDKLESEVNKWFAENSEEIEVVSRHVTSAADVSVEGKGFVNCTITIFYRPLTK